MDLFTWHIKLLNNSKMVLGDLSTDLKRTGKDAQVAAGALDKVEKSTDKVGKTGKDAVKGAKDLSKGLKDVGNEGSQTSQKLAALNERLAKLKGFKGLVDEQTISQVRQLSREITRLNDELSKAQSKKDFILPRGKITASSSKFGQVAGRVADASGLGIAGISMSGGLLAAGAVSATMLGADGLKRALTEERMLGRINSTAQLAMPDLLNLRDEIKATGMQYGTPAEALSAYEQALSLTNDKGASLQVLKQAFRLRAASGDVGADLSPTVGALGFLKTQMPTADLGMISDVLMSGKRLGAGELTSFARYLPRLTASGTSAGFDFKQTAGAYSMLTGMSSQEDAATLLVNLYSKLANADIRKGIDQSVGLRTKDGMLKDLPTLLRDLNRLMSGMTVDQRATFMQDKLKLNDVQAKQAMDMLMSNLDKLSSTVDGVSNSFGEIGKAINAVKMATPSEEQLRQLNASWDKFSTQLGRLLMPVANAALSGMNKIMGSDSDYEQRLIFYRQNWQRLGLKHPSQAENVANYEASTLSEDAHIGSYGRDQFRRVMLELDQPWAKSLKGVFGPKPDAKFSLLKPGATNDFGSIKSNTDAALKELNMSTTSGSDGKVTAVSINWSGPAVMIQQMNVSKGEAEEASGEITDAVVSELTKKLRGVQLTVASQ